MASIEASTSEPMPPENIFVRQRPEPHADPQGPPSIRPFSPSSQRPDISLFATYGHYMKSPPELKSDIHHGMAITVCQILAVTSLDISPLPVTGLPNV